MTIHAKLELENEDEKILDNLCRRWSSAFHTAYNKLRREKTNLHQELKNKFNLNYRYAHTAIVEAESLIDAQKELGETKSAIFGSRKYFFQLKKRHLSPKQLIIVKEKYQETRKFNLYSIGSQTEKGNVNTRIEGNYLRINIGYRKHIYARIHSKDKRWAKLLEATHYTVRIIKRDKQYYACFSFTELNLPNESVNFDNGVIGLDLNAMPSNVAYAEIDKQGNLLSSNTIPTAILYDGNKNQRDYFCYEVARKIVELAKSKGKGIVLENLHLKGLNRALSNFCFAKLREAIEVTCKRNGVKCITVWAAYTSMIGCIKYAPMYNLSRHTAAAMVIARRGLGLKDKLPKSFENEAKILMSKINEVRVTQKKKEPDPAMKKFRLVYNVYQKAISLFYKSLTGKSKRSVNWSILKKRLLLGEEIRLNEWLVPLFGDGVGL